MADINEDSKENYATEEKEFDVNKEEEISYFELDDPDDYPEYYESDIVNELRDDNRYVIDIKREDTRGLLAILYTLATFIIFALGFFVSILDAAWRQTSIIDNLSAVLPLISGIFLGTLGFVLGYYFRKIEDENDSN